MSWAEGQESLGEAGSEIPTNTAQAALCPAEPTVGWQIFKAIFLELSEWMNKDPGLGYFPSWFDAANIEMPIPYSCTERWAFWLRNTGEPGTENLHKPVTVTLLYAHKTDCDSLLKEKMGSFKSES